MRSRAHTGRAGAGRDGHLGGVHPSVLKLVHPSAHAALEAIVRHDAAAILACLDAAAPLVDGPVHAAAVDHDRGEDALAPASVRFGLAADRDAALAAESPFGAFARTWDASAFAGPRLVPDPDPRTDFEFVEERERVLEQLGEGTTLTRHVLNAAALEVNRALADGAVTALPRTEDFVVFVPDEEPGARLIANLRLATPEPVAARLRAHGLLPDRVTELEGFYTAGGRA